MSNEETPQPSEVVDLGEYAKGIEHMLAAAKIFKPIDSNISDGLLESANELITLGKQLESWTTHSKWEQDRSENGEASHGEYAELIDELESELSGEV